MVALYTLLGEIEFLPFHFSNLSIVLFVFLGVSVLTIHVSSMMYILKQLNTWNVINSIALFESVANTMGFLAVTVLSLLPITIGPSSRILTCNANVLIAVTIFSTGNQESYVLLHKQASKV